jgi:hypothetical protein
MLFVPSFSLPATEHHGLRHGEVGRIFHFVLLALLALGLTSCSLPGIGSDSSSSSNSNTSSSSSTASVILTISPASATVSAGNQQKFTAKVTGTSNTAVTWVADVGNINSSGVYTAPQVSSKTTALIVATSMAPPHKVAWARITVNPKTTSVETSTLSVSTKTLPAATDNTPYSTVLTATGGSSPYSWSLISGTMPSGLLLSSSGVISGTPSKAGSFSFNARVSDSASQTSTQTLTLTVAAVSTPSPTTPTGSGSSDFDGPAELPRAYVSSAMADTPAPGETISVSAGGNFQSALNSASCGDTIALQAGATFSGIFTVPANSFDDKKCFIFFNIV